MTHRFERGVRPQLLACRAEYCQRQSPARLHRAPHTARVHRILEGAGFSEVSLTPLDPVIQLAGPAGEAEAADFVMAMGPLARVLPSLSAAQRDNVRATLEVYFKGHATAQGVVLPAANWVVRACV